MKRRTKELIDELRTHADPRAVEGMARYGIVAKNVLGVSLKTLRAIAKTIGKDHDLALDLWKSEIFDARLLAVLIDDPKLVTESQMESWARDFDNWAITDGCCLHLFDRTAFAHAKALAWCERGEEFVKRAGFVLMAVRAVHDKKESDAVFLDYLRLVEREATDERNGVKKAVNWALRQIGKRSLALNGAAIETGQRIKAMQTRAARWIASDALRELTSETVLERLRKKSEKHSTPRRSRRAQ